MVEAQGTDRRSAPVELSFPASSRHLPIVGLASTSLGISLGLDVDQLHDLEIAVDELCGQLVEQAPPDARIRIALHRDRGHLVGEGVLLGRMQAFTIGPVSQPILGGLDVDWSSDPSPPSFRLVVPGRQHPRLGPGPIDGSSGDRRLQPFPGP